MCKLVLAESLPMDAERRANFENLLKVISSVLGREHSRTWHCTSNGWEVHIACGRLTEGEEIILVSTSGAKYIDCWD